MLLKIKNVTAERSAGLGDRRIGLRRVSMDLRAGEIFVLVGETGSGKSLLARLIAGVAGPRVKCLGGEILFDGRDLLKLPAGDLRLIRRSDITVLTRELMERSRPGRSVRQWLRESIKLAGYRDEPAGGKTLNDQFHSAGIVEPESLLSRPMDELPPMALRRLLVMKAILSRSRLLICDGVTTGLDRIVETQFIELLCQLREEFDLTILMTLESLRGVERFADQVAVFYEGGILESGTARQILETPRFAYTREFRACAPRLSDLPRDLPTISRGAAREAEAAIHETSSSLEPGHDGVVE